MCSRELFGLFRFDDGYYTGYGACQTEPSGREILEMWRVDIVYGKKLGERKGEVVHRERLKLTRVNPSAASSRKGDGHVEMVRNLF